MCAALALLDLPQSEALPPLECLFTIGEPENSVVMRQHLRGMLAVAWGGLLRSCRGIEALHVTKR